MRLSATIRSLPVGLFMPVFLPGRSAAILARNIQEAEQFENQDDLSVNCRESLQSDPCLMNFYACRNSDR